MSEDGPRMAADYDLVFADWDANTERLISIMSAHLPVARGTLLDATCRTGMACDAAVRMGWNVIGADPAPAMLERARARLPELDFRVTDVRRLFEGIGQSVDAVISIGDGLPALARDELGTAVAEMRRCTPAGGHGHDRRPRLRRLAAPGGVAQRPRVQGHGAVLDPR